jgi:hypothetical protein
MNRIVKKHYPASKLPEDLRAGLPEGAQVEIAISLEVTPEQNSIAGLVGTGRNVHGDEASVLAHIEFLRDGR